MVSFGICTVNLEVFMGSADELRVYLDHLIPRENLRYKRTVEVTEASKEPLELRIADLFVDQRSSRVNSLRKPDFQRATAAWTPDDCVSLLDSVINEQVIPSIIMWSSPENGYDYVLDGAHRISVVMAWLNDDWGANIPSERFRDEEQEQKVKQAAERIRDLVKIKIGSINDYREADEEFNRIVAEGKVAPKAALDKVKFNRARFYQRLMKGSIVFYILWVPGDYEKAEQSFVKINKSGRDLSDWEITLIENRHSSLARTIMSIANIKSVDHYWHDKDIDELKQEETKSKVNDIITGIHQLHNILLKPPYETPIRRLQQPLLVASDAELKPYYLAELFTIVEGGKGQKTETKKLIERDKDNPAEEIIDNGRTLVRDTLDALSHLIGSSPKSLAVIPVLYFYNESGRYVRSLLYGWLYWLFSGSEADILSRKRVFSIHRTTFEQVLLGNKEDIVTGITRKTGSGPEVTNQTAQYYQGLLELLVENKDDTYSDAFSKGYALLTQRLTNKSSKVKFSRGVSRTFTSSQKSTIVLTNFFSNPNLCGVCGGMLDPSADLQHDHILEFSKGGRTVSGNQRLTHPFCNNNREIIEAGKNGREIIKLPHFIDPTLSSEPEQLRFDFINDPLFDAP